MVKVTVGKPKGKATAYSCFVKACFNEHAYLFPNEKVSFTLVSAKCDEKWKENRAALRAGKMTEKEKAVFVNMAAAVGKRYKAEMMNYKMVKITVGKPKGTAAAYRCFVKVCFDEHAARFPNQKVPFAMSAICDEKWKEMTEKQKAVFVKMAAADGKRYDAEMANDKAVGGSVGAKGASKRANTAIKNPHKLKRRPT